VKTVAIVAAAALAVCAIVGAGCDALRIAAARQDGGAPTTIFPPPPEVAKPYAPKYGGWTACRIWGGGYVQNVVVSPGEPKRCYAYVDMAGLYRSDDGGDSWRTLNGAIPNSAYWVCCLSIDPRDPDKLVIATRHENYTGMPTGIFISDDGGKSFRHVKQMQFAQGDMKPAGLVLARNPAAPDTILAAGEQDGVWESRDNGKSWSCLGAPGLRPSDIRCDQGNGRRIWLCSPPSSQATGFETGFFRSDDGGRSWKKRSEASPTEILQLPYDHGTLLGIFDYQTVKMSRDGGDTWLDLRGGLPAFAGNREKWRNPGTFKALAAGPDFALTANTVGDFFRLDKGATRWRKVERAGLDLSGWNEGPEGEPEHHGRFGWDLASITVAPENPQRWYCTDWYSVWRTSDAGVVWKAVNQGMAQTVIHAVTGDLSNPSRLLVGLADNGPFLSTDGGESFTLLRKGIYCRSKLFVQAPGAPKVFFSVVGMPGEMGIFKSPDGGESWSKLPGAGLPCEDRNHPGYSLAVDHQDEQRLFAGVAGAVAPGKGGVYESRDSGASWAWIGDGLRPGEEFFCPEIWNANRELAVSKDGSMVCVSYTCGGIFYWDSRARSWKPAEINYPFKRWNVAPWDVAADPFSERRFVLGIQNAGVFVSEDGGRRWRHVLGPSAGCIAVDPRTPGRLAASLGEKGMALSGDGGHTWSMLDPALPTKHIKNVLAFAGNRLFVGTPASGVFWIELPKAKRR